MTDRLTADFRPGGVVLVRAVDAEPRDLATVVRQLGQGAPSIPGDEPDITIRFVEAMPSSGTTRSIGLDDAAATDTDFLILRGRQRSRARVAIPLDKAGTPLEIVCERTVRAVPLLVPLINMAALAKGIVAIHASAVRLDDCGILIVGWSKGGKTETVLALMRRGAEFVGDEWIYLHPDGRATGLGEPIRIWDWQVAQLPWLAGIVGRRSRAALRVTTGAAGAVGVIRRISGVRHTKLGSVLDRAEPIVRRQASIQVPPERLFPGLVRSEARIDTVILASSSSVSETSIAPIDGTALVEPIVQSNRHERLDLIAAAAKFRFSFPDRPTTAIDAASDVERGLLGTLLAGKSGWRLDHPYPPTIEQLGDAVAATLEGRCPAR